MDASAGNYLPRLSIHFANEGAEYDGWNNANFPVTCSAKTLEELAGFKYQIDIGGAGGTTWDGTIKKLALPGLYMQQIGKCRLI